jgi:O-phospho-L-seryl-tRNASec:L-selenocysteinyl-tRNA synthase
LSERVRLAEVLRTRLATLASSFGERLLSSPKNSISFAMSLSSLDNALTLEGVPSGGSEAATASSSLLGSQLFYRNVSGCRVIKRSGKASKIGAHTFANWGAHTDILPCSYLTAAASIGLQEDEIDLFLGRLEKCLKKLLRSNLVAAVSNAATTSSAK